MLSGQQLKVLAKAMTGQSTFLREIDAGYTYLGQFIAHDIVPETSKPNGGRTISPFLNLDSLYGKPGALLIREEFPIGPSSPGGPNDLPRYGGIALIPEPRNDENVVVAQLHLFWQRFHNYVLMKRFALNAAEARRLVTLTFQLVVVEDYLRLVLAPAVFNSYFRCNQRWLNFSPEVIPREFALAAFRFGHSMVRASYELRSGVDANLLELFRRNENLDPRLEIDWKLFFGWAAPSPAEPTVQDAMLIDLSITPEMGSIPTERGPKSIVQTNLQAGEAAGLLPGTAYVAQLLRTTNGAAIKSVFDLEALDHLGSTLEERLRAAGSTDISIDNLPLWPYLLLEAEAASNGFHLGTLGSLICAEVLANAIAHAEHSIYPQGHWVALDDVLATLGPLGRTLQSVRRRKAAYSNPACSARTLCMRHLIELVENPDLYP